MNSPHRITEHSPCYPICTPLSLVRKDHQVMGGQRASRDSIGSCSLFKLQHHTKIDTSLKTRDATYTYAQVDNVARIQSVHVCNGSISRQHMTFFTYMNMDKSCCVVKLTFGSFEPSSAFRDTPTMSSANTEPVGSLSYKQDTRTSVEHRCTGTMDQ